MLIYAEAFVLTFLGCVATNIDNILLVLSSGNTYKARQSALIFVLILEVYILLALMLSYGVELTIPRSIVWLGLIPFTIGVYELRPRRKINKDSKNLAVIPLAALAVTLSINSIDTLIVQVVLFSDIATKYHPAALAGASVAAVMLGSTAFALLIRPASAKRLLPIAAKARPWILIAVGLLILMDTGFDTTNQSGLSAQRLNHPTSAPPPGACAGDPDAQTHICPAMFPKQVFPAAAES